MRECFNFCSNNIRYKHFFLYSVIGYNFVVNLWYIISLRQRKHFNLRWLKSNHSLIFLRNYKQIFTFSRKLTLHGNNAHSFGNIQIKSSIHYNYTSTVQQDCLFQRVFLHKIYIMRLPQTHATKFFGLF